MDSTRAGYLTLSTGKGPYPTPQKINNSPRCRCSADTMAKRMSLSLKPYAGAFVFISLDTVFVLNAFLFRLAAFILKKLHYPLQLKFGVYGNYLCGLAIFIVLPLLSWVDNACSPHLHIEVLVHLFAMGSYYISLASLVERSRVYLESHSLPTLLTPFAKELRDECNKLFLIPWFVCNFVSIPFLFVLLLFPVKWYTYMFAVYSARKLYYFVEDLHHNDMHNAIMSVGERGNVNVYNMFLRCSHFLFHNWTLLLHGRIKYRYEVQHICCHHVENNGLDDLESTLWYDRSSIWDFSKFACWMIWYQLTHISLADYLYSRKKWKGLKLLGLGLSQFVCCCLFLFTVEITLFFIFLQVWWSYVAAFDAWYWHCFNDVTINDLIYGNSMCLKKPGWCNSGDHIAHHIRPSLEWYKVPKLIEEKRNQYQSFGPLIFHFKDEKFFYHLMCRDFTKLESSLVSHTHIPKEKRVTLLMKATAKMNNQEEHTTNSILTSAFVEYTFGSPWVNLKG